MYRLPGKQIQERKKLPRQHQAGIPLTRKYFKFKIKVGIMATLQPH